MSAHNETANCDDDGALAAATGQRSRIEKLTASLPYWLLRTPALLVALITVGLGLLLSGPIGIMPLLERGATEGLLVLVLAAGGALGLIGLFFGWRSGQRQAARRLNVVEALIVIGIVTAASLAVPALAVAIVGFGDGEAIVAACLASLLLVLILDGCGALARLRRLATAATGGPPDALPALFLTVALALLAGAIAAVLAAFGLR